LAVVAEDNTFFLAMFGQPGVKTFRERDLARFPSGVFDLVTERFAREIDAPELAGDSPRRILVSRPR
jgi:hypothetical protein